jgi:hypothetical protein
MAELGVEGGWKFFQRKSHGCKKVEIEAVRKWISSLSLGESMDGGR